MTFICALALALPRSVTAEEQPLSLSVAFHPPLCLALLTALGCSSCPQKNPPLFSHLFTSFMLIHSFCRNASVRGQTQGKEKGFSLVILSFPCTPLCHFRFFLIPPSLHPAPPPHSLPRLPLIFVWFLFFSLWNPLQEARARLCQLWEVYFEGLKRPYCGR